MSDFRAMVEEESSRNLCLQTLKISELTSSRLVLIANKLWLLRHLRRFASHLHVRLKTLRSLGDLDSLAELKNFDVILLLQGSNESDDLYTLQCLHLFWHEIPVLFVTAHELHVSVVDLPSNVKAIISETLGWTKILSLALEISKKGSHLTISGHMKS